MTGDVHQGGGALSAVNRMRVCLFVQFEEEYYTFSRTEQYCIHDIAD